MFSIELEATVILKQLDNMMAALDISTHSEWVDTHRGGTFDSSMLTFALSLAIKNRIGILEEIGREELVKTYISKTQERLPDFKTVDQMS